MKLILTDDDLKNINQLFIKGDYKLLQILQNKHFPMVYSLVKKMGGDDEGNNAKDVYTDSIIVVWQQACLGKVKVLAEKNGEIRILGINKEHKNSIKFSTYLHKIAGLQWLKSPLNQRNNKEIKIIADDFGIFFQYSSIFNEDVNNDALYFLQKFKRLSPVCKWIIVMRKFCKLQFIELASIKNISVGYSRNLFSRCWQNLINKTLSIPGKTRVENLSDTPDSTLPMIESIVNEPLRQNGNNLLISIISEKMYYQNLPAHLSEKCKRIFDSDKSLKEKLDLFIEINSFLDEFQSGGFRPKATSKALNNKDYFKFRNTFFGQNFDLLPTESRVTMILHHNSCEDLTSLSALLGLKTDETITCIHNHKTKFAELLILDSANYTQWLKSRGIEYGKQV